MQSKHISDRMQAIKLMKRTFHKAYLLLHAERHVKVIGNINEYQLKLLNVY